MSIIAGYSGLTINQWRQAPDNEQEIIWLDDPKKYFFVRTRIFWSARRDSKPKHIGGGPLLGYSVIKRGTKRNYWRFYVRRYFYLQELDLEPNCIYYRLRHHPAEGVSPITVKPGIWGVHLQPQGAGVSNGR